MPSPSIGSVFFTLCTEGLMPALPDEPFQVLGKPGMAEQSVLFFAPTWKPQKLVLFHATGTETAAVKFIADARALRRQILDVFDGQTVFKQAVILSCQGAWR